MESNSKKYRALRLIAVVLGVSLLALPVIAADLLSLVPEKAVAVGMVDVDDLRTSPLTARLFDDTDKVTAEGEARRFLEDAGLDPSKDIDRVMIAVSPNPDDSTKGDILVAAEGRFDVSRLSAVVAREGAIPQSAHGKTYFLLPKDEGEDEHHRNGAVAFVSGSLSILGTENAVTEALGALAAGGTNFKSASLIGRELHLVERGSTAWMIMDVQRAARLKGSEGVDVGGGHEDKLGAAVKHLSTIAVWGRSGKDAVTFGGTALSADSETRQLLEDTVRGLLAMWRLAAQDENPELVKVLRGFKVDQTSEGVTVTGSIPASLIEEHAKKMAARE